MKNFHEEGRHSSQNPCLAFLQVGCKLQARAPVPASPICSPIGLAVPRKNVLANNRRLVSLSRGITHALFDLKTHLYQLLYGQQLAQLILTYVSRRDFSRANVVCSQAFTCCFLSGAGEMVSRRYFQLTANLFLLLKKYNMMLFVFNLILVTW